MNYKDVAFEIANDENFFGIGLTLEDLEKITKRCEELSHKAEKENQNG